MTSKLFLNVANSFRSNAFPYIIVVHIPVVKKYIYEIF